jgi:hypothetical protein
VGVVAQRYKDTPRYVAALSILREAERVKYVIVDEYQPDLLGTDKSNPLFTVSTHEEGQEAYLHVYYGRELLEVVPADREDPNLKMLVGRLYDAGLKCDSFRWPHATAVATLPASPRHGRR